MRLLPSLRGKRRYLAFRILSGATNALTPAKNSPPRASAANPLMPHPAGGDTDAASGAALSRREFTSELERSSQSLLGDTGSSECGITVLSFDGTEGIVLCARSETVRTRAVLATICSVGGRRVAVRVIGISGTVKGAKRFFGEEI